MASRRQRVKHYSNRNPGKHPGDVLSFDLAGPINIKTDMPLTAKLYRLFGKKRYLGILVDKFSSYYMVNTFEQKSQSLAWIKSAIARMETENPNHKVRMFYTDGESVTNSTEFHSFCAQKGINHQMTNKSTPQHNGAPERGFQTLFNSTRAALLQANLPPVFWPFAVHCSAFATSLLRAATSDKNTTRYEQFHNKPLVLSSLKVFGCNAEVHVLKNDRDNKLSPRAVSCIYLGQDSNRENGSIFLNVQTWTILHARTSDVLYSETEFTHGRSEIHNGEVDNNAPFFDPPIGQLESSVQEIGFVPLAVSNVAPPPEAKRPPLLEEKRDQREEREVIEILDDDDENEPPSPPISAPVIRERHPRLRPNPQSRDNGPYVHLVNYSANGDQTPTSYVSAMRLPDAPFWKGATEAELKTLEANDTYTLVDRPKNRKVIGSRWVYKLKVNSATGEKTYKARLVAKGYSQLPGVILIQIKYQPPS